MVLLVVVALWVLAALVVAGLCMAAADGDAQDAARRRSAEPQRPSLPTAA